MSVVALIVAAVSAVTLIVALVALRTVQALGDLLRSTTRRLAALEQRLAEPGGPLHGQLAGPNTLPPFGTGASAFAQYPPREPPPAAKSAP